MSSATRNVTLYSWYVAFFNGFFWFPIFFLYFTDRVGIAGALQLESIYYAAVVLLEVPTGYASDRLGRRGTLRASALCLVASYAAFLLADDFASLAVAQALLAMGYALNSGTDTAFHLDSLEDAGRPEEYADREARAASISFGAVGISGLLGGAASVYDLRAGYALSLLAAVLCFGVTMLFTRPVAVRERAKQPHEQLAQCFRELRDPTLRWLFLAAVSVTILVHVPYQVYQPYLRVLGDGWWTADATPAASGIHAFAAMLVATAIARHSSRVVRRLGMGPAMVAAVAGWTIMLVLVSQILHPLVALLLVFRSAPRALVAAPLNAAVTPRLSTSLRASYLSLQSLAGRLAFSGFMFGLSWVVAAEHEPQWQDVSAIAIGGAAAGAVLLCALLLGLKQAPGRAASDG